MVHKVKSEVRYATEVVETNYSLSDGTVVPAETAQQWVDAIREVGDFPETTMAGTFQFQGLQEAVTEKIEPAVGICDNATFEGCVINVEAGNIYQGDVSASQVVLRCAAREFLSAKDAKLSEEVCNAHHAAAAERIATRITGPTEAFIDAKQALAEAQAVYATAEHNL